MKHIVSKRIFESKFNDMIEDIKDICLDLTDGVYNIDIQYNKSGMSLFIKREGKDTINKSFKYIDVKEIVDRVIRYLGPDFTDMYILNPRNSANDNNEWVLLDGYDDDEAIGSISGVKIEFNI